MTKKYWVTYAGEPYEKEKAETEAYRLKTREERGGGIFDDMPKKESTAERTTTAETVEKSPQSTSFADKEKAKKEKEKTSGCAIM